MARKRNEAARQRQRGTAEPDASGYYAYEGLDRVLHEKARLGILTALLTRPEGLLFVSLRELCALTDGNLSRHIQVLQEAALVEVWKSYEGNRPQTLVRLSRAGREQFQAYLQELERVIFDARAAQNGKPDFEAPSGWVPA